MEKPKSPAKAPLKPDNKPGQIRHDKSGRAIWEWAVETGRHALDSTSRLLKKLDNPGLSLEETARIARVKSASQSKDPAAPAPKKPEQPRVKEELSLADHGGFNPYNSRAPVTRRSPPAHPAAARPAARLPAPQPASSPGVFSRLFGGKK